MTGDRRPVALSLSPQASAVDMHHSRSDAEKSSQLAPPLPALREEWQAPVAGPSVWVTVPMLTRRLPKVHHVVSRSGENRARSCTESADCPNRAAGGLDAVVSIGKLAVGQADYYLEQARGRVDRSTSVGSGVEDYYVQGTEAPGYWLGSGSASVQAVGTVEREALVRVLEGCDPSSGRELVAPHARRVPGFDITFSAPKSVSMLFGLGDESLQRTIRSVHESAVADALGYLERVAAKGRRGAGGAMSIQGSGFVAAAFRHRTSRAGDPQLHTHVLIANLVKGLDGRWSALDGRAIYQHAKTAGYLYEARLRAQLTELLGVEWTSVRNGIADIEGVPKEVLRAFSRRRAEIEAELLNRGESSSAAARMATLSTRQRKDYGVVPEQLVAEWRSRAARLGFDRAELRAVLERGSAQMVEPEEWDRAFARLAAPTGLTRRRTTFAPRDVVQALCEAIPPGASVEIRELEAAAEEFPNPTYPTVMSPRRRASRPS